VIVLEVKGGSSELGARNLKHATGKKYKDKRGEQGSSPYFQDIQAEMTARIDRMEKAKDLKGAHAIQKALDAIKFANNAGKLKYQTFRQSFEKLTGDRGKAKQEFLKLLLDDYY
jgi:hypothetical protein